jgi:hypothetical protein
VYKFIENKFENDVIRNLNISKNCYNSIKKQIRSFIIKKFDEKEIIKLGVEGKAVQVDETAICRGVLFNCLSQLPDDTKGITWFVGIIEEKQKMHILKL